MNFKFSKFDNCYVGEYEFVISGVEFVKIVSGCFFNEETLGNIFSSESDSMQVDGCVEESGINFFTLNNSEFESILESTEYIVITKLSDIVAYISIFTD